MKLGKGVFKEKIAKHDLAKAELDTLRKTILPNHNDIKQAKTLQTDLDKK
jgi:hypothetical protein